MKFFILVLVLSFAATTSQAKVLSCNATVSNKEAMTPLLTNEIFELKTPEGDVFEKTVGDYKFVILTSDFGFEKHFGLEATNLKTGMTASADFSDRIGLKANSAQVLRMKSPDGSSLQAACTVKENKTSSHPNNVN